MAGYDCYASSSSLSKKPGDQPIRIFLAAPYSRWMEESSGRASSAWRRRLDGLRVALVDRGAEVFSAHHSEAWGERWRPPDLRTRIDLAAMRACDAVCALVGAPPSGGVAVELGWASALAKPCLLMLHPAAMPSPLIAGLGSVTVVDRIAEPNDWSLVETNRVADRVIALSRPPFDGVRERHPEFCSQEMCEHDALTALPCSLGPYVDEGYSTDGVPSSVSL
jgi:nucleoside 2-deoxyribosyltransferase